MKQKSILSRAFTLIELLVVITIIGIIAGLLFAAIPRIMGSGKKAKQTNNLQQIVAAFRSYTIDQGDNTMPAAKNNSLEISDDSTASMPFAKYFADGKVWQDSFDKRADPQKASYMINEGTVVTGKENAFNGNLGTASHQVTTYLVMPSYQGDPNQASSWQGTLKEVKLFNVGNVPKIGINDDDTLLVGFLDGHVQPVKLTVLQKADEGYDPRDIQPATTADNN